MLGHRNDLMNINIFTGSIPDVKEHKLNVTQSITNSSKKITYMNIPTKMYKIVVFQKISQPDIIYMEVLIADNKPYYFDDKIEKINIEKYLLPRNKITSFLNNIGIDINRLLEFYNFSKKQDIRPFRNSINMIFYLSPALKILMQKSKWYGFIIYSKTLENLEKRWDELQYLKNKFVQLEYHEEYYNLAKKKLSALPDI